MNPRQVKQAMRKLGIKTEELEDVSEVVIRTKTKQYVIRDAAVTIMEMQGQKQFQVVGEAEIIPLGAAPSKEPEPTPQAPAMPEDDIKLVMEQTGASREKAIEALMATEGQPAEAILKIMAG
ncbi:MAG: nascent polypeptide-associated complex protein [Methanomassiliicoccales archaeon]|nr:nascent polypeptide-associated complex protein [Methanomassiliicoccales archaeon]